MRGESEHVLSLSKWVGETLCRLNLWYTAGSTHTLAVLPTDVVYSREVKSINAVLLSEEIMFASTARANNCHCRR